MKKLIILSIAFVAYTSTHAQSSRTQSRNVIFGTPRHSTGSTNQNRSVIFGGGGAPHSNPYPATGHTERNWDRDKWHKRKHRDDDDDRYERGHEHHDNGRHLGWYKGKGNPHGEGHGHGHGHHD